MAKKRGGYSRSGSRSTGYVSRGNYGGKRRPAKRGVQRRAAPSRGKSRPQTVKIVIEYAQPSSIQRPDRLQVADNRRKKSRY